MPDTDITREARELCERATPGEWSYEAGQFFTQSGMLMETEWDDIMISTADAAFIARSRTLIPELLDQLAERDAEIARMKETNAELIKDIKTMALAMRESEELSEGCCFACFYSPENNDNMEPWHECPGYETDDCFKWRGDK